MPGHFWTLCPEVKTIKVKGKNIVKRNKKTGFIFIKKLDRRLNLYILGAALMLGISVLCAVAFSRLLPEPVAKYELETSGNVIDFAAPEIAAHSAEDGIAVVVPAKPEEKRPALAVADPADIWEAESSPTHGGFTLPVAMDGDSIGILTIPGIGLSVRVYESDSDMEDMERGAAHFKSTSAWMGNIGISAHNVNLNGTPGYFLNLYTLEKGDIITYETALGVREYVVDSVMEISENDWSLLDRTEDNRITLITCITGKPALRLAVVGAERLS